MRLKRLLVSLTVPGLFAFGCATYPDVKELKSIGYSENLSKGKSVGQIEAADCAWSLFGYQLGSYPEISKALSNARTQKSSSSIQDMTGTAAQGETLRYVTNVSAKYDSFNAYIVGRTCINVKGLGYL